ncbi:MAG: TOBE domain-containing protein, partial [Armatimonadetes bacterium]|nr:TOBE domain-containing protein [Armatimonadota bacterium]
MFKQWNVLVLFGLVALVGAFGCAKEEAAAEADSDTGEAVATEIGHGTRPPSLRATDGLELMLRADDIAIFPSEKGVGRIAGRVFQGAYYLYEVELPSGSVVHSMESHTLELPVGTRVDVSKVTDHPLLCFKDGRSTIDGAMHFCSDWHTHDAEYHAHEHTTDGHS